MDEINELEFIQAKNELSITFNNIHRQNIKDVEKLIEWDELHQQLDNPIYFPYWHSHRIVEGDSINKKFNHLMLYNVKGESIATLKDHQQPFLINTNQLETQFQPINQDIIITYLSPIKRPDSSKILGYLAINTSLKNEIKQLNSFIKVDIDSLIFTTNRVNSIQELIDSTQFNLNFDQHNISLDELIFKQLINLSFMVMLPSLIILLLMLKFYGYTALHFTSLLTALRKEESEFKGSTNLIPIKEIQETEASILKYHSDLQLSNQKLDEQNKKFWTQAHTDALTNIQNRRAFDEFWLKQPEEKRHVNLMLIDINSFKAINDTYGHNTGDEVLKIIASCLQQGLREEDQLYRLGGDEFAIVISNCVHSQIVAIANRCNEKVLNYPFAQALNLNEPVRISIGISESSEPGKSTPIEKLLHQADNAMYESKKIGHQAICFYKPYMTETNKGFLSLSAQEAVFNAIKNSADIQMFYQPINSIKENKTVYYEALVRIKYEDGYIYPDTIFSVIEAYHLEVELDKAVVNQIFEDLKTGIIPNSTGVSINLSASSIIEEDVTKWFSDFLPFMDQYKLIIEVTETSLITQFELAINNLNQLRTMGFLIALDDFGSGYSSIKYLTSMPVDIVKFDISLIQVLGEAKQYDMIKNMVSLISQVGHQLVAEGIENSETLDRVNAIGFDSVQGYYLGKPKILNLDKKQ